MRCNTREALYSAKSSGCDGFQLVVMVQAAEARTSNDAMP
jgi:hypothetical protein